uniref:Uncharacterized protein n=1 Tax=Macrostomum lignano TaxID=282301 RepID=A0A1I8F2V4_9PLAT
MAGSRRLRRLRLGSPLELSAGAAATVSLRFADSARLRCPTRYRAFAIGAPERLRLCRQAAGAQRHPDGPHNRAASVALQFCAARGRLCPVDIGEMLRLPEINEVTAEIRAEGDATLLLFSAFLTTSEAPLPQSPVRLGATFRQDCLLGADELEV